jgi:acyl-CoA dehydrogenase
MLSHPFPQHLQRLELRQAVRALCQKYSLEYWDQHDRDKIFPEEWAIDFAAAGFKGAMIPTEFGGGGGEIGDSVVICEEVAAAGGGINAFSSVNIPLLCVPALLAFGTDEQKQEFLPKIATGDLFVTFGVTEPDAGTDTTRIRTAARQNGVGKWLINGTKVWNSGALRGDKILVLVRTSEPAQRRGQGLTLFLTDLRAATISIRPIPKIGRNAVASAEVFFTDHPVNEGEVIGTVGEGFYHLLNSLNGERLLLSGVALGMGRWALENATNYAQNRRVFDRAIGQNQAVQHPLARGYMHLLAASEVLAAAVNEYETKGPAAAGALANTAKYLSSEAAFNIADDAMQIYGGYSFAREYHIGRHWIESRLQRIAPVNNQMVLNYIAERMLELPRSY